MKRIVYIIALVFALAGGAFAQSYDMTGVEVTKGTFDSEDSKVWGNTFTLHGNSGELSYNFTISMDYISEKPTPFNEVAGGHWTLAVFKNGEYVGTLYGEVLGGTITWNFDRRGNPISRNTSVKVKIHGRTNWFEGVGEGNTGVFVNYSSVGTKVSVSKASLELEF